MTGIVLATLSTAGWIIAGIAILIVFAIAWRELDVPGDLRRLRRRRRRRS
jgi:hypothetical protein